MSTGGRRLRNVTAQQAIRAFNRLGFETVRVRGSHHILKHSEHGILVLPFHRGAIRTGILLDALKKANIPIENFLEQV